MKFEKGRAKTGGRQKGSVNKNSLNARELLDRLGCNPLQGLAEIASDQDNSVEIRTRAFAELARYVAPQLRSTEITGAGGGPVEMTVRSIELLKSRIASLASGKSA